jgi:hypothetical protein
VIGQILDYAANAVSYWTIEEIKYRFEESCKVLNQDVDLALSDFLQNELEPDIFWETAKTNLKAGKIRMLIIADTIPKELQRIIEFLNEQMVPAEILGVEIKQFIGQDLKTLVPRVIGLTSNAQTVKGKQHGLEQHWTEETFFAELLTQRGEREATTARKLVDWIKPKVTYFYYGVGRRGSLAPILKLRNKNIFCFALWTGGSVEIYFQHMKTRPPFDNEAKRKELLDKLNLITGLNTPLDKISARPNFPIRLLVELVELNKFIEAFNWYFKEAVV